MLTAVPADRPRRPTRPPSISVSSETDLLRDVDALNSAMSHSSSVMVTKTRLLWLSPKIKFYTSPVNGIRWKMSWNHQVQVGNKWFPSAMHPLVISFQLRWNFDGTDFHFSSLSNNTYLLVKLRGVDQRIFLNSYLGGQGRFGSYHPMSQHFEVCQQHHHVYSRQWP